MKLGGYFGDILQVSVRKPVLQHSPHKFADGKLCYLHPTFWNPGRHDLCFVIARTAKWLAKYEVYCIKRRWPGAGIEH